MQYNWHIKKELKKMTIASFDTSILNELYVHTCRNSVKTKEN